MQIVRGLLDKGPRGLQLLDPSTRLNVLQKFCHTRMDTQANENRVLDAPLEVKIRSIVVETVLAKECKWRDCNSAQCVH